MSVFSTSLIVMSVTTVISYVVSLIITYVLFLIKLSWVPGQSFIKSNVNSSQTPSESFNNLYKYYKKYGKTYKLWIGATPVVYCQDQDIVQLVFKQEDKTCRPLMYRMVREYLGPGLLFGETDNKWKAHRRYLTESFHTDILEQNVNLTMRKINSLIELLQGETNGYEPVDLIKYMKPCFLDVSLGTTAGFESKSLEKPESYPYLEAIESMSDIVMARVFDPLLKFNCFFQLTSLKTTEVKVKNIIKSFIKRIVSERNSLNKENDSGKRKILVDLMLSMQRKNEVFSLDDVENQVSNHIMAAFDTLSTVTSYLLFLLGNHLTIQEEVVKEIDSVAPNILTEEIKLKELSGLKLLDRCFKEALRMYPAAPIIGRRLVQPIETKDGTLPAGLEVYTNLYNYHRNEEVFPDPDSFDPDRFLPDNCRQRHPQSWMPFGIGIRSCIGQKSATIQCKVAVAMILKRFIVKSYEKPNDLKLIANLVLKSRDGVRVYLQPRD